jgi:hypothetical protein
MKSYRLVGTSLCRGRFFGRLRAVWSGND